MTTLALTLSQRDALSLEVGQIVTMNGPSGTLRNVEIVRCPFRPRTDRFDRFGRQNVGLLGPGNYVSLSQWSFVSTDASGHTIETAFLTAGATPAPAPVASIPSAPSTVEVPSPRRATTARSRNGFGGEDDGDSGWYDAIRTPANRTASL